MKIKVVNKTEFELPKYETIGSAGMDLRANLKTMNEKVFHDYDYTKNPNYGFLSKVDDKRTYEDGLWLRPHTQYIIPTGIFIQLPKPIIEVHSGEGWGYEAQIRPRSGLAAKHGITIVNCVGTIDSDYRGEIMVILMNLLNIPHKISHGDRIAQMIINRYERISWYNVESLDETERGGGGLGHTGN